MKQEIDSYIQKEKQYTKRYNKITEHTKQKIYKTRNKHKNNVKKHKSSNQEITK